MFKNASNPDQRIAHHDQLIVHVTATRADQDVDAAWVDQLHRGIGWRCCGYHAVITRDGEWQDADSGFPARPIGQTGSHVGGCGPGQNRRSFGVSMAGGIDAQGRPEFNMTAKQVETLRKGIRKFLSLHPNPSKVEIMGHRDLIKRTGASPKACPCFDVIPWWAGIEADESEDEDVVNARQSSPVDRPAVWVVSAGDTLYEIMRVTGVSVPELRSLNPSIGTGDHIQIGQQIRLL